MDVKNWDKVRSIFGSALEVNSDVRSMFVDKECAGDAELRDQVNELLSSYDTDFLEPKIKKSSQFESDVLQPGQKVCRYEVIRLLGVGGMGEVYLVKDESLDRLACLKVFSRNTLADRMYQERFVREAQIASARNHPHICTIYEINKDNDPPFIAMEYIEGRDLAEMIATRKLIAQTTIDLALQIADGLADAHEAGIVHRDIKPANIIVNNRGTAKILDFGLAKRVNVDLEGKTQEQLSVSGVIMGTVSYMSPEQVKGEKIDTRSDIFSFGVLLYEMITRELPFDGNSTAETMALILTADPKPLFSSSASRIETLIRKCLEKDKAHRFQSMSDVIAELKTIDPQDAERSVLTGPDRPTVQMPEAASDRGDAWSLYLLGRVKAASENHEEVEGAIALLEEAVKLKPTFAEAYAVLAQAYTTKAFQFASDAEKKQLAENAEVAVETALSLNPNLAEGHFARGVILWTLAKRFPHEQAIHAHKRAIELDPNLSEAHHRLGLIYFHIGLLDQARNEVKKALELNPNNTMARFRLGTVDAHQGKFEDAIAIFKTIPREISPSIVDRAMADALVNLGRYQEADALVDDYFRRYPHDEGGNVTSVKAVLLAKAGKRKEAEATIRHAIEIGRGFGHFHHTAVNIAAAYAILDEPADAVKWLRNAADNGFPCYPYFEMNPNFQNVKNDAEFISLMAEIRRSWQRCFSELFPDKQATKVSTVSRFVSGLKFKRLLSLDRKAILAFITLLIAGLAFAGWLIFGNRTLTPAEPKISSLAVLPLENLSGDPSQEYFADGMTEALISDLSQIKALKVISRTSIMQFKGSREPLPDIAQKLGVDAIIEGSVLRSGDRVRITANLIPAKTNAAIWSHNYERGISDILKLQGDVAQAVASEVSAQLTPREKDRLSSSKTVDPKAHETYLLGRHHASKYSEADIGKAIEYYQQAIEIEPDYADAYAALASAWLDRGIWGDAVSLSAVESKVREAATNAIRIDPDNANAHVAMCQLLNYYDYDWTGAEKEAKRALEIDPNSVDALRVYSWLLQSLGRHEEVVPLMEKAEQLDPASTNIQSDFGRMRYRAKNYPEAESHLLRAIELDPSNYAAFGRLGDVYIEMGRFDEAVAQFEKSQALRPQGTHALRLAVAYARMGDRKRAIKAMATVVNRPAWEMARLYTALGNYDKAFEVLNQAFEGRNTLLAHLKEDPSFDPLHSDPRWQNLLKLLNFPT